MKKILCTLIVSLMFSLTSYAGQWQYDDDGYRYQNEDGSYKTGWYQDVDNKWYYMDEQTGYMLMNTVTPDGYQVSESGEWNGGKSTTLYGNKTYDNTAQFVVTAVDAAPEPLMKFDYELPVTVFYNTEYTITDIDNENLIMKINNFELSKEGVLYAKYSLDKYSPFYELNFLTRYIRSDGSYTDENRNDRYIYEEGELITPIMISPSNKEKYVSAEVYIDMSFPYYMYTK